MSTPIERALEALPDLKQTGQGQWLGKCPAHNDRYPSLSVGEGANGQVLLHCFAGCRIEEVLAKAGLQFTDLYPEGEDPYWTPSGPAIAIYQYMDEDHRLLYEVTRTADKQFRQRAPDASAKGGYRWSIKGVRRVPFRLPQLLRAVAGGESVYITEGEKDALALERRGLCATTCSGGAGKWREEFGEIFRGAMVYIIADDDPPGRDHAWKVYDALKGSADAVTVLGPKEGNDASDHLDARHGLMDFVPLDRPEHINGHSPGDNRTDTKPTLVESAVFRPVLIDELVDSLGDGAEESADWLVRGIVARGVLSAIGGRPKSGKSTASSYLAKAVAAGDRFWDLPAVQAPVLWINFEVSEKLVAWKFRDIGAMGLPLFVWSGTNQEMDLDDIDQFVQAEGVGLVMFDSLARLWRVTDENDAVQTGQAVDLVLQFTRSVDAASWLIVHHRKAGSADSVDLLRGSNATPAIIDIITALKKWPGGGRKIEFDSRYDETPQDSMIVDISADGRYDVLGDERSARYTELCDALEEALTTELQQSKALAEDVGKAGTSVRRALDDLVDQGKARRTGNGKRGDPYLFGLPENDSTTIGEVAGGINGEKGVA